MDLINMFKEQLNGNVLNQMNQQSGLDSNKTSDAAQNIFSTLMGVVQQNVSTEEGAESLNKAIDKDHDGSIMGNIMSLFGDDASNTSKPNVNSQATNGSGILNNMLGNKQQNVIQQLSQMNNMSTTSTQSMMQSIAPMIMGMLGQAKKNPDVNTDNISDFLNKQQQPQNKQVSGILGMLDQDGDGSIMDDLGDMLGKFF